MLHSARIVLMFVCMSSGSMLLAAETETQKTLPEPLTLEYALTLADETHPDLVLPGANYLTAQANKENIEAENGFNLKLEIGLLATDEDSPQRVQNQDHARAGLIATKTLYDFGLSDTKLLSANESVDAQRWLYYLARGKRRLAIQQAYFNVLLSDLNFSIFNESMAVGYVNFDKAKDRREQGQQTDLDVLQKESEYQRLRVQRYKSENLQRATRARLAEVLNRPGNLSNELAIPNLPSLERELPDIDDIQALALKQNYTIQALRHEVRAAESALEAARSSDNAKLNASVSAHEYDTHYGSSDEVRAELTLNYDLYTPSKDSAVAGELAKLYTARARLDKAESELRQQLLELWNEIEELRVKRESVKVLLQLREIQLEKSRALYEMEVTADLGYSMSALTQAQYESAATDYHLALAWYKLDLLTAKLDFTDPNLNLEKHFGSQNEH